MLFELPWLVNPLAVLLSSHLKPLEEWQTQCHSIGIVSISIRVQCPYCLFNLLNNLHSSLSEVSEVLGLIALYLCATPTAIYTKRSSGLSPPTLNLPPSPRTPNDETFFPPERIRGILISPLDHTTTHIKLQSAASIAQQHGV